MERTLLLLLLIAVTANAGRILPRNGICAKTCNPTTFAKFKFQPGRDYHYDYVSHTLTALDGDDKQSSGLRIKAKASFEVVSQCEMVLMMRNVRVEELSPEDGTYMNSPRTADFKAAVEQHELHFSFNDGTISELCPVKDEVNWVLNVKRGVVSMMQNTMFSLTNSHIGSEIDVAGDCKVRYTLTPNGIRREKDLMACSGRENRESALQSIPYFVRSNTQATPLTKSSHVCHQTLSSNGHFEKILCEEEHRLHTIGKEGKGARTSVTQSLTYVTDSDSPKRSHAHTHRRTTLKFDFEKKTKRSGHELSEMREYLREVCAKSRSDIRPETPRFFTEIVYRMRRLNERDLNTIFALVDRRRACRSNNDIVRRLVIDAVPILGNAQSMALMKTMIIKGRVSNIEANLWLTSLAFVKEPTHDMLKFLQPLLDEKVPRSQAVLGLSAMVHQYCKSRRECYTELAVQEIGRSLRRMLNGDCSTNGPKEQTMVLLALKAIGNAGVLSVVSPDLVRCINKDENPMAIRVAATEAFRRMDCSVNRRPLIEVYKKQELDSELRINTYLAVMTCPSEEILEVIKTQLNVEKVNQVGSFVWTHLTNLAETNDPLRKHLKNIVEDVKLKREFKLDKLKFSRNIEKSVFFKSLNAGGRMESNVIWSQKSFLPRSASLNLTTHLFGQSYNFLEFNGRIEGLETILERYFGPDGYFKKETENKTTGLSNKDFQFMDNKFKLQNDRFRAGLGLKVFGHEVLFFDCLSSNEKQKQGFNFLEILIKLASNQEMEWSKNFMFLDSKITVPTISGLPLELSINGTASMAVRAKGKLDIRRMVSWPTTFDIDGTVQPSGSVEVSAMMGVNAYYTRHGLKLISNAHTSTQIDAKLKAQDSETFHVEFGMPRQKQEIVNFESKLYVVHRNAEKEHSLPNIRRINKKFCTGNNFQSLIGAQLCATVRTPKITTFQELIVTPIVGPFSASVALYKEDTHTSYRLTARWQRKKHRLNNQFYYSRFARLELDTPKSRVSRRHLLDFALDFDKRAIRLHLENPQRRIGISGAFTNKLGHKELKLSFFKDSTAYFDVSMSNQITRSGSDITMTPSLKIMIPGVPFISLQSKFVRSGSKYQFNIELKNLLRSPLMVGGSYEVALTESGETTIGISTSLQSHIFVGSFSQSIRRGRNSLVSGAMIRYGPSITKQHTAAFNFNLQRIIQRGERRYRLAFNHRLTQFKSCRSKILTIFKYSRVNFNVKTTGRYGLDLKKNFTNEIGVKAVRNAKRGITITYSGSLIIPHLNRSHSGKMKIATEPQAVVVTMNYKHRPTEKTFKLIYDIRFHRYEHAIKLTSDLAAHYKNQHKLTWDMKAIRHSAKKYTIVTSGTLNGKKAKLTGELEFPRAKMVSSAFDIRVGDSEVIKMNMSSSHNIFNPFVRALVNRNGDAYSLNARYDFQHAEPNTYEVEFSSDIKCPYGLTKSIGLFKTENGNFDGNLDIMYGAIGESLKKMSIETNYQLVEEGNKKKRDFELKWKHPLRSGHVQLGLEKEDYKGSMHLELETAPKKRFVIDSMYELDDGWTQKGLMASLTVKTPFKKFERTHLGINLLGQLRYRKAEIHFLWGNNKRIVTTLVIRPTGGTNFLATLKVITPFARYSYMRFHMKNEFTGNQLQSELISEIGTKKAYLKVYGVNNGDYYTNDLAMSVSMNSPFQEFRDITFTIDHKDDSNQYNSKLEFKWNKNKKISTVTNFNYHRNGAEIRSTGVITYTTPFTGMEQGSLEWRHQNTKSMMKSEVDMEYLPQKKIGIKLNGLITEPEAESLRVTAKCSITSSVHGTIDTEFLHYHTPNSLKIRAVCDLPESRSYEFEIRGNKDSKRIEGNINLNTPHDGFRKIGSSMDIQNEDDSKTMKVVVYAGNTQMPLASLTGKLILPSSTDPSLSFSAALKNKIIQNIEISAVHQHTLEEASFNSITELTYAPSKTLSFTNEVNFGDLKKFKASISTPFQAFRTFQVGLDFEGDKQRFQHNHFINYNDKFELSGGLRYNGLNHILAETKVNHKGFHYFRFSHKKNGAVYECNLIITFKSSNTIRMNSEIQIDPSLNIKMRLTTPFEVIRNVQARLTAERSSLRTSSEPLVITGSASYNYANQIIAMNGIFNMKDKNDMRARLEVKTPFENIRDISVILQHSKNGNEFVTTALGKSENGRIEVSNIFQNIGTLKNKFAIKTSFTQFKGITFGFEHRGRFPKMSHRHNLIFDIAGVKARLSNKFDVFKFRLIELESIFRSNVEVIKKAGFRFTFDKPIGGIETGLLVEWPQDKVEGRIAFKASPENKIQLKISTPFYYFKELQGLYTLQNQGIKKFKHHIILAFKNEPLTIAFENSLTLKTLNYIDAQLNINTPLDSLKSLYFSYHHEMLKRGKSVDVRAEYNANRYSFKGSYNKLPIHVVDLSLSTPHTYLQSINFRNELTLKDSTNWKFTSELFSSELDEKLTFNADLKKEQNLIEVRKSLSRNGKLLNEVSFKTNWQDKKAYTATLIIMNKWLPKSEKVGQMIFVEGTIDLRKAISLRATLRTPFEKVENQWLAVRFERNEFLKTDTMKTGNLVIKGNLLSKNALLQARYSYGKRPSFLILVQLPEMQDMKLEGSLVMSTTNSYMKMSLNVPDFLSKPWTLMIDVIKTKTMTTSLKLETSIEKFETIAARASITKEDRFAKIIGRLSMPLMKKPIEFNFEGDLRSGVSLVANLRGPYVRYFRSNLHFSGDSEKFETGAEVFSVYLGSPFTYNLKFSRKSGLKIENSIRTPIDVLKRLFVEVLISKEEKRGHIEIAHNKLPKPIRLEGKVSYSDTNFKGRVFLKTPFEKAEHSEVNIDYERDGYKVTSKLETQTSAMEGKIIGKLNFDYEEPKATLKAQLETPFEEMKEGSVAVTLSVQKDFNARVMVTHNKLPGEITGRIELQPVKSLEVEVSTPFQGWYKHMQLSANLQKIDNRHKFTSSLQYYPANVITTTVQVELALPKIFLSYNIATPYQLLRQSYGTIDIKADENFVVQSELYHNALNEKITLSARANNADTKTLTIQLNSPFSGPLKDISVKLYLTRKAGAFDILKTLSLPLQFSAGGRINYHMGNEITAFTSVDVTSIKKFLIKMKVTTPFDIMKNAGVHVQVDAEKNVLLVTELTHNKLSEKISARFFTDVASRIFFLRMNTPFNGPHKRITVDGSIKQSDDTHQFQITAEYHPGKQFSLIGNVKADLKDLIFNFKLNTPFENMKELTGKLKFNPTAAPMMTFEVEHNKLNGKIEGRFHMKLFSRLKVVLKTPFDGVWKNMLLDYRLKRSGSEQTATAVLKYHPDSVLRAQLSFEKLEKALNAELTLKTPFTVMKKTNVKFNANWEKGLISTTQLSHNKLSDSIHVEINYSKKDNHMVQVILKTPFEKLRNLDIRLSYMNKDDTRKSSVTISYNQTQTYELHGYTKMAKTHKEVSFGLKTPFSGIWRAISFSGQYKKEGKKYSLYTKSIYDLSKTIEVAASANTDINDLEFMYSIKTPFEVMKFSEGKFKISTLSTKYLRTAVADKRIAALLEFIHPKLMEGRKLTIKADGKLGANEKKINIDIKVMNKAYNAKMYYEKDGNRYLIGSSIVTDRPDRPWFIKADIMANGKKDWEITASTTSPKHRLDADQPRIFQVKAKHVGDLESFNNHLYITSPYKKDVTYTGYFSKADNFKTRFVLQAPMSPIKEIKLNHDGYYTNFKSLVQATLEDKAPFVLSAKMNGNKAYCEAVINLNLPIDSWKETTITMSQTRSTAKTISSRAVLTKFDLTSTAMGNLNIVDDFKMSSNGITNSLSMKNGLKNIKAPATLTISFKASPITIDESSAEVTISSSSLKEDISLKGEWKKTSNSLRSSFEINAIKDFLKSKAVLDIPRMTLEDVLATFTVTSQAMNEPAKVSVNWRKSSSSIDAAINSQVPIKFLKSKITISIAKMTKKESDASITVESNDLDEPAKLSVYWKKSPSSFQANVNSKIPVKFLKSKVDLSIPIMTTDETNAELTVESAELNDPASVSVSWKKTDSSLNAKLQSKIPILKATAIVNIPIMSSDETTAAITVTSENMTEPSEVSLSWKKTSASFTGRLKSKLPVKYLQSEVSINIPKMSKKNVLAIATLSSKDLSESSKLSVGWDMTDTSFEAFAEPEIPVKFLKSRVALKIPTMTAKETTATFTLTSKDLSQPCEVNTSWKYSGSSFKASIESKVPVEVLQLKSSLELKSMKPDNFDGAFKLTSQKLSDPVNIKLKWNKSSAAFDTNFELETPADIMKKVNANFFYKGDIEAMDTALTISANKLGSLSANLKWNKNEQKTEMNVNVLKNSETRRSRRSVDSLFSMSIDAGRTNLKINIEIPKCKIVKKIELNYLRTEGSVDTSLSWDENNISFLIKRPTTTKRIITVKTTFDKLRRLNVELDFPITDTELAISVKVEHPKGTTFVKVAGKKENGIKLNGTIENTLIPKVPNMSFRMDHEGTSARKFKNAISLKVGNKEGNVDTKFNILDKTEGSIKAITPFEEFEKQMIKFTLDRSKPKFTADVLSGFVSAGVKVESTSSPADAIIATVNFNEMVFQSIFTYSGTAKSFKSGITVTDGAGRVRRSTASKLLTIEVSSDLKDSSYSGSIELESKFLPVNYQKLAAQVSTKGDFRKFKDFSLEASGTVNKGSYSTELNWDCLKTKSGSISIKFPGKTQGCVISGDASLNLSEGVKVESKASKCDGEIYNFNLKSNLKNKLNTALKSTLQGSNTELSYAHTVESKKFSGKVNIKNDILGEYTGLLTANWETDVNANLKLQMPENKEAEFDLKQTGDAQKMTIEATLTMPTKDVIKTKLDYSISNPITIDFTLDTPYEVMKKTEIHFKYNSGEKLFKTELEFKHNKLGDYSSALSYDGTQSAKVIFTLKTPHEILNDLKILFSYKGKITTNFDHSIFVTYNGVKMGYSINLILPKLLYRIEIDTPFIGYRKIVITNEHEGNKDKFSHKVKVRIGPSDMIQLHMNHIKTSDSYKGSLRFKSAFKNFEDIHLKLHQQRAGPNQWLMNHKLIYAPGKVIHAQGILDHGLPDVSTMLTITTPFPQVEVIKVSCEHKHRSNVDFNFRHTLKVNKQSGTFRGHLKKENDAVNGLFMLDTPFDKIKHFDANFRHTGGLRKFTNDFTVTYAIGRAISLKTRVDSTSNTNLKTELHLSTPFEKLQTGRLILRHLGTLRKHFQQAEIGVNDKTFAYNGMVSVENPMDMATEHTLSLPFEGLKTIKIHFDRKNSAGHLNLEWNRNNYIRITGILSRNDILLAQLVITTSFARLQKGALRLKHSGSFDNSNTYANFDFNGAQSKVNLRFKRSTPELLLQTSLPSGVTYEINTGLQKSANSFQAKLKIVKNNEALLDIIGKAKYDFSRPEKFLNLQFKGIFPMIISNEINMELTFRGNDARFMVLADSNFFNRHFIGFTFNYNTYNQIFAKVSYNGTPFSIGYIFADSATIKNGKNLAVKVIVGEKKGGLSLDMGKDKIVAELFTPFQEAKNVYLLIHHRQKSRFNFVHRSIFRLNKHRYVNLDLSVDSTKGRMTLKAPAVVNIKYSMAGARIIRAFIEIDPDKNDATKKIIINTFLLHENDSSRNRRSREFSLNLRTKTRDLRIETRTVESARSFFHKTTINPDHKTSKPWQIFISTLKYAAGEKKQQTDEWILSTPVRQMKVFMETHLKRNKLQNDVFFHWDNQRAPLKKLGWRLRFQQRGKEQRAIISFHHPKFRDGVTLTAKSIINSGSSIIRAKANFRYTDNPKESIDLALKISRAGPKMLRGSMSIRQEATMLDTKLSGSFGGNRGVYINGLTLWHRMNGKTKEFQILSHVNVLKRSLMLEVVTPARTLSWMTVAAIHSKGVTVTYQLAIDRSKKAFGELVITKSPSFKTRLYVSPGNADNYVETYGRFVNKKHFEFQIHRMMANRRYSDFVFTLRLQGEHLLKSRLFWRPTLLAEAQQYVQSQVEEIKNDAKIMWPKFVNAVKKEWNVKKNLFIATIPNFDDLREYSNEELNLVREDLYRIAGMLYDSYIGNDFYLRDVVKFIWRQIQTIKEKTKVMRVSVYQAVWVDFLPRAYANLDRRPQWKKVKKALRIVFIRMSKLSNMVSKRAQTFSEIGKRHIHRGVEKVSTMVKSMHQKYSIFETKALNRMSSAAKAAHLHYMKVVRPRVDRVRSRIVRGLKTLSNYHRDSKESILSHFHEDLQKKLNEVHTNIQRGIDNLSHRYGLLFHSLRRKMNQRLKGAIDLEHARFASGIIKSGIKNIQWAYDQFDVEQKLKDFGHAQYLRAIKYVKENSIDIIRDFLRLDKNRVISFKPQKGRIEGQVYIPFQMHDLQSRPDFSNLRRTTNRIRKAFRRPSTIRMSYLPSLQTIKNRMLTYIPNIEKNPRAWIPTFHGYASIAGKHIVTFDKVHYDLDGNCDYVLSRDYKGQKWAVILNQQTPNRYITFTAYNKIFSIHPDHSVTVDGMKVELPFVHRNLSILRFGPIIKAKDTLLGFSVTSDVVNDIHTLGVIGWYHGKLGGLFGNFDNEPYNDMQTIDHQITEVIDTFIQSWALGNCRHNNNAGPHRTPSRIATKVCKFLFKHPLSPMAKCFRHVEADPFLKLCFSDVDEMETVGQKSRFCRAATMYALHCRKSYVDIDLPRNCRKCPVPGRTPIKEDQSVTIENTKATADVVFVVEESPCNKDVVPKLSDIVRRMELAFKRRGITENRYGLVGFGRKVHGLRWPITHSHTVSSKLMGDAESFMKALSNFEMDEEQLNSTARADPLRAIIKASEYPLRPGSARHMVVVPCFACQERRVSINEVEDTLDDQDIILYVLTDHQLRLRRPSMTPRSNYLFGVDKRAVFTQRDVYDLQWNTRLHRQVILPPDACSRIAFTSGGAIFNSGKLTRMHVTSQGWFAQVFANRVASSSNSPRQVDCECNFTCRDRPQLICKKSGSAVVKGIPQPVPLPLALPESQGTAVKLEYRR